jgi:hypothetical protein
MISADYSVTLSGIVPFAREWKDGVEGPLYGEPQWAVLRLSPVEIP